MSNIERTQRAERGGRLVPPVLGRDAGSTLSRRAALVRLGTALPIVLGGLPGFWRSASAAPAGLPLTPADDRFLEDLERTTFRFFWECADPRTGLVKDRSRATEPDAREIASIAATGFGLTALCIADQRRWLEPGQARERARATLRFLRETLPHEHGFYFHFVNWRTGERAWKCELSSIDTALLLCGVLTCRQHFADADIRRSAGEIYDRVDWRWMMQGGPFLLHGWKPESGFLKARWDTYCEHSMLYLLALGANQHPIPAEAWHAWKRPPFEYAGFRYINPRAPLFIHQFSHAWFDFRDRRDCHTDYFENSVKATKAHRQFCLSLRDKFPHFSNDVWGITASDSAKGYVAWGGPPAQGPLDGTLVPCAAGGSLPFLPGECLRCLRTLQDRYGERAWKHFGFVDAFNPATGWFAPDVIGIDAGITLLMAENARTGFVWRTFMKNEEAQRAMAKAGFSEAVPK
ncbi:MAG: hypothetical protein HZA90_08965 [Verrucomicrobia bacterium]|nr:hypothetical protein [Verrucomicrobiota bacterium]